LRISIATRFAVDIVKDIVGNVQTEVSNLKNDITDAVDKVTHLENTVKQLDDELLIKMNAMLEVQNIVYSTIKDDNIRNSVNSILIAAKHSDAKSKAKLQEELDALREELKEKNAELDAAVSKMVDKITTDVPVEVITQTPEVVDDIRRY
jgi:gas vesicle protein